MITNKSYINYDNYGIHKLIGTIRFILKELVALSKFDS